MCLRVCVCGRDGDADQMSSRRTKADLTSDHVLVIFGEHPDLLYDIRSWNYLWWASVCVWVYLADQNKCVKTDNFSLTQLFCIRAAVTFSKHLQEVVCF